MKKTLLVALFASAFPFLAQAATLKFPSDKPIASITIPDSWGPEETDSGVQATSDDAAIYLSVDVASSKTIEKVVSDAIDFLQQNDVTVDQKTQKETPATEVNGMQISTLEWDGKDADGPVSVGLAFVVMAPEKALVMTYWGTKGDEDKHSKAMTNILMSIKPAK